MEKVSPPAVPGINENRIRALANLEAYINKPEEMKILRVNQQSMMVSFRNALAGGKTAGYFYEASGTGKTAAMVKIAEACGLKTVILSPTQQILEQTFDEAKRFTPGLDISKYYQLSHDPKGKAINTTYRSVSMLLDAVGQGEINPAEIGLVIADEAHMALGEKQHAIFRHFPNSIFLGATATPWFRQLEGFIDRGIVEPDERWTGMFRDQWHDLTLEEAFLRRMVIPTDIYMVQSHQTIKNLRLKGVKEMRDYSDKELDAALNTIGRNSLIMGLIAGPKAIPSDVELYPDQLKAIENLHKLIKGKRKFITGTSIGQIEKLAKELREKGIKAAAVHHKLSASKRQEILKAHEDGEITDILGVDMLSTGWDSPKTEVLIMGRPRYSSVKKTQEFGRILRRSPQSGKERAIVIDLIDSFPKTSTMPVIIPDLFDPDFVLRGTQTGRSPSKVVHRSPEHELPLVTFSGYNLDVIIQKAELRKAIQERFTQSQPDSLAQSLTNEIRLIREESPDFGIYAFCLELSKRLPGKIPAQLQKKIIEDMLSDDEGTRNRGNLLFFLVNAKTFVSATEYYMQPDDNTEAMDEMFLSAYHNTLSDITAGKLNERVSVSQQLFYMAKDGIALYRAQYDHIPLSLANNDDYARYRAYILKELDRIYGKPISQMRIDQIVDRMHKKTKISKKALRQAIAMNQEDVNETRIEEDSELGHASVDYSDLYDALDSLSERERYILERHYGLKGREMTLEEVGIDMGSSRDTIRKIKIKAMRKLRHPSKSHILKQLVSDEIVRKDSTMPYLQGNVPNLVPTPAEVEKFKKTDYSLDGMELDSTIKKVLNQCGIRTYQDFFYQSPYRLWITFHAKKGELADYKKIITYMRDQSLQELKPTESKVVPLLMSLSEPLMYRVLEEPSILDSLDPIERMVIQEKLGKLDLMEYGTSGNRRKLLNDFRGLKDMEKYIIELNARYKMVEYAHMEWDNQRLGD